MNEEPLVIYGGLVPYWKKMSDKERKRVLDIVGFSEWVYLDEYLIDTSKITKGSEQ